MVTVIVKALAGWLVSVGSRRHELRCNAFLLDLGTVGVDLYIIPDTGGMFSISCGCSVRLIYALTYLFGWIF